MKKRKITKAEKEAFSAIGRIGGLASTRKLTKKQRVERGRKASKARWDKVKETGDK